MRLFFASAAALAVICVTLDAQQPQGGFVRHQSGTATVVANDPRPLDQAIAAVREEYGWVVDYEDPPYQSSHVLSDISSTAWHAMHPGKKGFLVPAGGAFQSTYAEGPNIRISATEEQQVLDKILADYNKSGNPGKFALRKQSDGGYVAIAAKTEDDQGNEIPVSSILDTLILVPQRTQDAQTTLQLIMSAISAKSGIVCRGGGPLNLLSQSKVTVGGNNVAGRELLMRLIEGTGMHLVWDLWYEPNMQQYHLWIQPVPGSPILRPATSP